MSEPTTPLTPELCRTFVTLARLGGSVTATARELGLNEASVSKRIRPLVRGAPPFLPRPWLFKKGRIFHLTDEGRAMLPAATEQAEIWRQFIGFASAGRMPGLTVACGQEAAGAAVLRAAAVFRRTHPQAPFRIAVVRSRRRIEGVASGLYDLALLTQPPAIIKEIARCDVSIESLHDDELMMACAAKSAWIHSFKNAAKPIDFDEIASWPLVLPEADSPIRKQWDERMRRQEAPTPPQIAIEVGGWRVLLDYVLAGFGVGLLPRSLVVAAEPRLRARPLPEVLRPANRLYSVRLPTSANSDLVAAFANELQVKSKAN